MLSSLQDWPFKRVYEASNHDLIEEFYVPCLDRSHTYDRAAGYFRSSIYQLVSVAISDFALRGGKMRLICSPSLSALDEAEIRRMGVTDRDVEKSLNADIEAALADPEQVPVVELLATLLRCGALDIRIAYKADERGIFHSKVGIFADDDSRVSFEGSANETLAAWDLNEERFKCFLSWSEDQLSLVESDEEYFDALWRGEQGFLEVRPLPQVPREILESHAALDPQEAVERVRRARRTARRFHPERKRLQDHQRLVRQAWWEDRCGIVDHVTGGGKTVTALAIVRDWYERVQHGTVVVLVPSDLLSRQWNSEIRQELADLDVRVLQVGGSQSSPNWRELVTDFTRKSRAGGRRLVLATMDSAATESFVQRAAVAEHTLLVADEVHKLGARRRRRCLDLEAGGHLGLSATPERFGDPEGTTAIFDYFGEALQPSFSIADAQASDPPRLVPYDLRVDVISLNPTELAEYERLSKLISALTARAADPQDEVTSDDVNLKLIQRARVLKGAEAKVPHAVSVLESNYRDGDRWLVYCDDITQLEELGEALATSGLMPMRYTSEMAFSKPDTIQRFETVGGVLLSIRCLDEGVDIPLVTHALLLASSVNPREHLQRRGRVLRAAPGKSDATVFDTLVGPSELTPTTVFSQELARAHAFAADARNKRHVTWRLDGLKPDRESEVGSWAHFEVEDEPPPDEVERPHEGEPSE